MTDPIPDPTPVESPDDGPTRVSIRRAPKLRVFVVLGGLIGFLVTLFATGAFPADPKVGFVALLAYFCLYGVSAGILLGAVVGIVADRLSVRRQHTVIVERERYMEPGADDDADTDHPAVDESRLGDPDIGPLE